MRRKRRVGECGVGDKGMRAGAARIRWNRGANKTAPASRGVWARGDSPTEPQLSTCSYAFISQEFESG